MNQITHCVICGEPFDHPHPSAVACSAYCRKIRAENVKRASDAARVQSWTSEAKMRRQSKSAIAASESAEIDGAHIVVGRIRLDIETLVARLRREGKIP